MKKPVLIALLALLVAALPTKSQAGDRWSAEQKDLWSAIESCTKLAVEKNASGVVDCYHSDFSGWLYSDPVPRGKAYQETIGKYLINVETVMAWELRPIDIKVYGNVGFAHYFLVFVVKDAEGKHRVDTARWTDIMLKEGGKWRWIGDHGGAKP
jgi:ketosteroid isomerase-like protein